MGILSIVNAYLEMLEEISFNLQEGSEPFAFLAAFQARMLLKTVYFLLNNYGHQLEPSEAALLLQRAESVHNKFQVNL